MAYQRAQWHSGLTYRQTCRNCKKVVEYTDHSLDFRPWYADGFVYCPVCRTPLRHNENLAIVANTDTVSATTASVVADVPPVAVVSEQENRFCTQCGKKANADDRFCSGCGKQLI